MPPRGRGAKVSSVGASAPGRQSARQAAQQAEEVAAAATASESSMQPPSTLSRAAWNPQSQSRDVEPAHEYARRGTRRRAGRDQSIGTIVSQRSGTEYYNTQSESKDLSGVIEQAESSNGRASLEDGHSEPPETQGKTLARIAIMKKFPARLFDASEELVAHLAENVRSESWADELVVYRELFETCRDAYASDSVFINANSVLAKVGAHRDTELWVSLKKAIATANLACLSDDIELINSAGSVDKRVPKLQSIDEAFPTYFVPVEIPGFEQWAPDLAALMLAIDIRTQRLLETMRGYPHVPALHHFAQVFYDVEIDALGDETIDETINNTPLRKVAGFDINPEEDWAAECRAKIGELRALLSSPESVATIEQHFDFGRFSENLKKWALEYFTKIKTTQGTASVYNGGDEPIAPYSADAQLVDEASQRYATNQAELDAFGANVQRLKQFNDIPLDHDFISHEQLVARGDTQSQSSNATGSLNMGASYAESAVGVISGRKRARVTYNEGNNEDFETDNRRPAPKRARPIAPMAPPPRPAQNPGPRPMPTSSMPGPPSSPGDIDVVALTQQSKLVSLANRKSKQPKARRPWTARDTQTLIHAVNTYKAKWSTIERQIREGHLPFDVAERDQQGLRDKARLVKVDLMKTDAILPPGFDLVVMGKKEKDMIIAAGRNPERQEADIDENGTITNYMYAPVQPGMAHNALPIIAAASASSPAAVDANADAPGDIAEDDAAESIVASVPKPEPAPVFEEPAAPTADMGNEMSVVEQAA